MTNRHYSPRSVTIVATEIGCVLISLATAIGLDLTLRHSWFDAGQFTSQLTLTVVLYLGGFYYADLYNFAELQLRRDLVTAALRAFSTVALICGVIFLFTPWLTFSPTVLLVDLVVTIGLILLVRTHIDRFLKRYGIVTRIAIVGTGPEARGLAAEILRRQEAGHEVTCFVTAAGAPDAIPVAAPNPGVRAVPVVAASSLLEVAQRQRIKRILVATADVGEALPLEDLLRCKAAGYQVEDGHTFYERLLGRIFTADLSPQWLIFSHGFTRSAGARAVKRVVDVAASIILLVLAAPLSLGVAAIIKLEDRGPVLFGQTRAGRQGAPFTLWKFRSMRVDAESTSGPQWAKVNDPRVTRVGRWIRDLRIDEIPQAWNVLRGDMSFIGPRPERPEFVAVLRQSIRFYDHRHAVRPGITGWAQINCPYGATVEEARDKLEYDLYYLKNFSVLMDVFILLRTVKIIMFGWGSR